MKFTRISHSIEVTSYSTMPKDYPSKTAEYEIKTLCEGDRKKDKETNEFDAKIFLIDWIFGIQRVGKPYPYLENFYAVKMQYGMENEQIHPTDDDIIELIEDSFKFFELKFYKDKKIKNSKLTLSPLTPSKIQGILVDLKPLFSYLQY